MTMVEQSGQLGGCEHIENHAQQGCPSLDGGHVEAQEMQVVVGGGTAKLSEI